MPISRITRNSLVYANNIRQNIETRLFGLPLTSGSFYLQNSQSLYLQDLSGTYVLEYASPIALSYNSYYNKFIADRSTQNSSLRTRYYNSESKAQVPSGFILYQNSRSAYAQNLPDVFLVEYSTTSSLLTDTGSINSTLRTRYYNSESKAQTADGYILYQNSRSAYTQNLPDIYLIEYSTTSSLLTDTGSINSTLRTRYYNSESKAQTADGYILYQNSRSAYTQDLPDIYLIEYPPSVTLSDTGSSVNILRTRYYNSESKSSNTFFGYQNDRTVYLENTANTFVIEYSTTSSLLTDTGSLFNSFNTRYYISESIATSSFLGYQNDRAIYLENTNDIFIVE